MIVNFGFTNNRYDNLVNKFVKKLNRSASKKKWKAFRWYLSKLRYKETAVFYPRGKANLLIGVNRLKDGYEMRYAIDFKNTDSQKESAEPIINLLKMSGFVKKKGSFLERNLPSVYSVYEIEERDGKNQLVAITLNVFNLAMFFHYYSDITEQIGAPLMTMIKSYRTGILHKIYDSLI